jgi:signal transduction histidine kinase
MSRPTKLALLVGAVALPAIALAAFAALLTLRVARGVEAESARYDAYLSAKVTEAFEQELVSQLRDAIVPAESAAREGGDSAAIVRALATRSRQFEAPHYVSVDDMTGLSIIMVESQMLLYGDDPTGQREHPFAAVVLRGPTGEVTGAGGWWFNPRAFLVTNLGIVVRDRLTSSPRMYGGLESTRHLSVQVFDPGGHEVARVRNPGRVGTGRVADMTGPFEGFRVRVTPTGDAPAALASRFVSVQMVFIGLLAVVMLAATFIGVRYIVRQIELVQVKSSFVSNVTHELKTPIAVIKLAVETLEMGRFRSEVERDKYLRTIQRETDRLAQLVNNILDFSRMESGQHALRLGPVDVRDVIATAIESFRLRLEDAGFRWELDVPERVPRIRADAIALQHCLLNLLDNAVKYSRERKEIRIIVRERDGWLSLAVSDRGIGIAEEDQKRIFEKFVRVETGLVHTVKGAGLGLSLVDQIVRAHHGRVEVASTPGEGSIFTLLVPVWVEGQGSPRDGRGRGSNSGGREPRETNDDEEDPDR